MQHLSARNTVENHRYPRYDAQVDGSLLEAEVASLRKSLTIYRGLAEVSTLIGSINDFDDLLRAILGVARRVLSGEAASLFLVNPSTGMLELAMASQEDGVFMRSKISVPKGRGIAGWVFEKGESVLIPDAYADSRFYQDADKQTGFRTRSVLCAPLDYKGRIIGVLQLLNPQEKLQFEPEDLEGFEAYARLTATAIEKIRGLERLRRQERMERDLAIAAALQSELLSRALPEEIPGACFAAYNHPAANVGGDFYDVFVKNPYEIYFAIGDVSGKGMAASLLMAQTLSALGFIFATTTSPVDALEKLNMTLHDRIVRGMFVTMLIGRLTPSSGRLELANAGHCKPLLYSPSGEARLVDTEPSLPLGILPDRKYRQGRVELGSGDRLICYTDGLSESKAADSDKLFDEFLPSLISGQSDLSSAQLVETFREAEAKHRGAGEQRDDLTILVGGLT